MDSDILYRYFPSTSSYFEEETLQGEDRQKLDSQIIKAYESPSEPSERTTQQIAQELQARSEEMAKRKKARRAASQHARKDFESQKKDLLLTLLKSGTAYQCAKCGVRDNLSIDHIKPVSKGGGNGIENLQILCRPCG